MSILEYLEMPISGLMERLKIMPKDKRKKILETRVKRDKNKLIIYGEHKEDISKQDGFEVGDLVRFIPGIGGGERVKEGFICGFVQKIGDLVPLILYDCSNSFPNNHSISAEEYSINRAPRYTIEVMG